MVFEHKIAPDSGIFILTGAGISAESGVSTFRDKDGIWSKYDIEDVATPEAFMRQPEIVHQFYNMRRHALVHDGIMPNKGHDALAQFEEKWPGDVLVVTQNVDDLHERAGSRNMLHMHGELLKSRCHHCGDVEACRTDLDVSMVCRVCKKKGGLRPDVVWFGEMPMGDDVIYPALARAGVFISVGTSGHVYPAAGFVLEAARRGALTIECNLERSANADMFDYGFYGAGTTEIPKLIDAILLSAGLPPL